MLCLDCEYFITHLQFCIADGKFKKRIKKCRNHKIAYSIRPETFHPPCKGCGGTACTINNTPCARYIEWRDKQNESLHGRVQM